MRSEGPMARKISRRRASRRRSRERTPPARGRGEGGEKTGKSSRARGDAQSAEAKDRAACAVPGAFVARGASLRAKDDGPDAVDAAVGGDGALRGDRALLRGGRPRTAAAARRAFLSTMTSPDCGGEGPNQRRFDWPTMCSAVQAVFLVPAVVQQSNRAGASRAFWGRFW